MKKRMRRIATVLLTLTLLGGTLSGAVPVAQVQAQDGTQAAVSQPEKMEPVIFEEDFEDGESSVLFGTGGVTAPAMEIADNPTASGEKSYKVTSPNGYIYVVSDDWQDWANYTFECKLYIDSWTTPGTAWDNVAPFVLADGTGPSNPQRSAFKYKKDSQNFAFFTSTGSDQQEKSAGADFEGTWHDYRFETSGSNVKVYVDEALIYDVTGPRSSGTIGFDGLSTVFYIDDLKLTRQTAGKVTADVESGSYAAAFDVSLTAGDGESIYYTLDGSDPAENGILYNGPVHIAGDCTLRAVAVADGKCYGEEAAYEYTIDMVDIPAITPVGGRYQDSVEVTMSCATADAVIRYTLDGSDPTESSAVYAEPLTITEDTTVKARAYKEGREPSGIISREYIITDDLVERRIYVETDGNDVTGDGSEENPFATIDRAREEVQKYNDDMTGDIEVLVGAGRYYIDEAIAFDENDSASNGRQIIYKSADGVGQAEIIGGREITGWKATTEADVEMGLDSGLVGKVYKVTLDTEEYEEFNALYVEGVDSGYGNEKAIMARTPNYEHNDRFPVAREGYLWSAGGDVSDIYWKEGDLTEDQIAGLEAAQKRGEEEIAQLYVWDGGDWDWFTSTLPIGSIDVSARHLMAVDYGKEWTDKTVYPIRTKYWIGNGARYYLQGNLAFLDVPGEYHYNKTTGELYYYPAEGVSMEELTVIAPQTQEIFRFEGSDKPEIADWGNEPDPAKQVSNITLDGFSMKDTEFTGFYSSGWNSGDVSSVGYGNFAPEAEGSTQPSYDEQTDRTEFKVGAVTMINTNHITVQNCSIHNTGLWGIALWRDNQYNVVQNCDIGYTGFGAITTDGGYPGVGKYNNNHTFYNLLLHHSGQNVGHAGTITIMNTGYSTFSHLEIDYTPRRALTMLGAWNRGAADSGYDAYRDVYSEGNLFEYISIYGTEQDSGEDSGVFFAMMKPNDGTEVPAEKRNYMNQIVIDATGATPSMHDKNTAHGMEFAMGVNGMTISNIQGVNSQSNTLAVYYQDGNMGWEYENINNNYYDENIVDDPEWFDESKMEKDQIGTTGEFPFAREYSLPYDGNTVPEDLYFGDDFESGTVSLRKWTVESGNPKVNTANMAEGPFEGNYSLELHGAGTTNPATLSRTFDYDLNKIVEVKFFDKRQDYAGSDKYGGRPNTQVRADNGETVVAIGANGNENTERYYYVYGDEKVWTDVQRCYGWHTFKFDYSSGTEVKLYIDDELIATLSETSFNYVAMTSWADNGRQACYDQFWIYGGQDAPDPGDAEAIQPPAEVEKEIFTEDFEGGTTTEWTKGGNKNIEGTVVTDPEDADNKVLYVDSEDGVLYFNDPDAAKQGNYVYEFKMRLSEWAGKNSEWYAWAYMAPSFYVVPSDVPAMGRYALKYDKSTGNFILFNGFANGNIASQAAPADFDAEQWHAFRIDMEDGTVTVYMDGGQEPIFQYTDRNINGGTFGFEGINAEFYVDDIKVTRKDTAAPAADRESGTYEKPFGVNLSVEDATADIFYTLDDTDPKVNGLYYYGDEPVAIDSSCTLKVVAIGEGKCYSSVVEYQYTLPEEPTEPEDPQVERARELLREAIAYAKEQDTGEATDAAREYFEKALGVAEALVDVPEATFEELMDALLTLTDAVNGLGVTEGDKTVLNILIGQAELMLPNEEKYVAQYWPQLITELEEAKTVYEDGNALTEDVQAAEDALLEAILAQRLKANKENLEELIRKAEAMDVSGYTAESVKVLQAALAAANDVLADKSLSVDDQAKVDQAERELNEAIANLVKADGGTGDWNTGDETGDSTGDGNNGSGTGADGKDDGTTVNQPGKTGDSAPVAVWLGAALLALFAGAAAILKLKTKRQA